MRGAEPELSSWLMKDLGTDGEGYTIALARAFVQAKHGHTREARDAVDNVQATLERQARPNIACQCELALVDAHVRIYEDRPLTAADANKLEWTTGKLDRDDHVGQALAFNQLCIHALHQGHFDKAQEYAEISIRLYREGGAEFGSLHLHTHLGQIRLMRGDIEGAERQYVELESRLDQLADNTEGLFAVTRALRSEVAYEMNALDMARDYLRDAMSSVEDNDAWLDVRAAAYRVRTRLAFAKSGLPGALTELAHCERMAETKGMPRLLRLMQVERVRVLTLSDELSAARRIMKSASLDPRHHDWEDGGDWALRQGTTAVAIARWLVRSRRCVDALTFMEPAEDFAIRGGQLLSLAKLRVIRATAHWRLNQKTDATSALLSAMRLLGRQPFRRFILDEGEAVQQIVQATLDGEHVGLPPNPGQRRQLSDLAHHWIVDADSGSDKQCYDSGSRLSQPDLTQKYLELLSFGLTNKEIGRTMGVSVNTVKYHLKHIFRELHVDNRARAIAEARRLRIISDDHPNG